MNARVAWILAAAFAAACAAGPPRPATLDTANDQCASCRMIVSDGRTAAQVTAPGVDPVFFDDLQCLREALRDPRRLPPGAAIFVTDFRTGEWVDVAPARFALRPDVPTPMASHWVAYANEDSRRRDPGADAVLVLDAAAYLGPDGAEGER